MLVWFLGQEDPLVEGIASHCGILAWRIPRTEEPGMVQTRGGKEIQLKQLSMHVWPWTCSQVVLLNINFTNHCAVMLHGQHRFVPCCYLWHLYSVSFQVHKDYSKAIYILKFPSTPCGFLKLERIITISTQIPMYKFLALLLPVVVLRHKPRRWSCGAGQDSFSNASLNHIEMTQSISWTFCFFQHRNIFKKYQWHLAFPKQDTSKAKHDFEFLDIVLEFLWYVCVCVCIKYLYMC